MTRPLPGILDPGELETVGTAFDVAHIQVRRDHPISPAAATDWTTIAA